MFERVVLTSEIIPEGKALFDKLVELKALGTKDILLLQSFTPDESTIDISRFVNNLLEENLRKQKEELEELGFEVKTKTLIGNLKREINQITADFDASLVIAAAKEKTLLGQLLYGELAYDIISKSKEPILLLRPDEETKGESIIENILFPTDFSENANKAFSYLEKIIDIKRVKVTLMHVQDRTKIDPYLVDRLEEFNKKDTKRLDELRKKLVDKGCNQVDTILVYGSPSVEILKTINDRKVTLTIMGSQGKGIVTELFIGSVSNNVARHAKSSVLLIPHK